MPFGVEAPVDSAARMLTYSIPMPDLGLTNIDNITQSWVDAANQQFAATFESGMTMMVKPSEYVDVDKALTAAAEQIAAKVDLVDIGSVKALVIEADSDATDGENPSWVEFVINDLDINLYSESQQAASLLEIASGLVEDRA